MKTRLAIAILALLAAAPLTASAAISREAEVARIAKKLKPIPDDRWTEIAGPRATEAYDVTKGDTLYDISQRLFNDPSYWPKIWALNNGNVKNPHRIAPGMKIAFAPGSGTSLPAFGDAVSTAAVTRPELQIPGEKPRPSEWRHLPPQTWEAANITLPENVDEHGFDNASAVVRPVSRGMDLTMIVSSTRLTALGTLTSSRSESNMLGLGDTVYLRSEDSDLKVGETYGLTYDKPNSLTAEYTSRKGFSYPFLGRVKIHAVHEGAYVGTIIDGAHIIKRGAILIPNPPRIQNVIPKAGPEAMEGRLLLDKEFSTETVAQHKQVFVDRGADDGITPGMVFRAYQYFDPGTNKRITDVDFVIDAEILIVQVSDRHCTGIIVNSLSPLKDGSQVVLLTDLKDFGNKSGYRKRTPEEIQKDNELDALDKDDRPLDEAEKKELRQLEEWKGNPPKSEPAGGAPPETAPVVEPAPTDEVLDAPPPPAAGNVDSPLIEPGLDSSFDAAPLPPAPEGEPALQELTPE